MYSVLTCGTCIHESKFTYEYPCNNCYIIKSKSKNSHYQEIKECERVGQSCEYGICSECNGK